MSPRGFNLFSALVAAVLFMAGVMLVQTMVSTEDRISGQIFSLEENFALSDAANLTRSDSIQTFNYHFREQLEDYLTTTDESPSEFRILTRSSTMESNYDDPDNDWDDIIRAFEENILLAGPSGDEFDKVLNYVSQKMVNEFKPGAYGRYDVTLDLGGKTTPQAVTQMQETMKTALQKARDDGEDFLEIVECDMVRGPAGHRDCPVGTFYFNIPMENIEEADYEELPRIVVKDLITGEEIKIAILPKSSLRVYIPLRFFKAVHETALHYAGAVHNNHSRFAQYRLGFCDPGCDARTDPLRPTRGNRDDPCPASGNSAGGNETLSDSPAGLLEYTVGGSGAGGHGLRASVVQQLCDDGYLLANPAHSTAKFININLDGSVNELGLQDNGTFIRVPIPECPFSEIDVLINSYKTKVISAGVSTSNTPMYCGFLTGVRATVTYRDTNPQYLVRGTAENGTANEYSITIVDTDFAGEPDPADVASLPKCVNDTVNNCCKAEGTSNC